MRSPPEYESEKEEVKRMGAEQWMLDLLTLNPSYTCWGPYEDYMWKEGDGWDSRIILNKFSERWPLDDLNELVNFYFYVKRDARNCEYCDGSGLNAETKEISDSFYGHSSPTGIGWSDKITQDEVEKLIEEKRLSEFDYWRWNNEIKDYERTGKPMPTAEEVNAANRPETRRGFGHDAINRWILIEHRARRLGVWGKCSECSGHGDVYTAPAPRVGLILWMLHPRKGCSRGIDIKNVTREELPEVFAYLKEAADRNAERFEKITALAKS